MNDFKLPSNLKFLGSTRFWGMTLGIVASLLLEEIDATQAIQLFFAGFVGIRTVDRFGEKTGKK